LKGISLRIDVYIGLLRETSFFKWVEVIELITFLFIWLTIALIYILSYQGIDNFSLLSVIRHIIECIGYISLPVLLAGIVKYNPHQNPKITGLIKTLIPLALIKTDIRATMSLLAIAIISSLLTYLFILILVESFFLPKTKLRSYGNRHEYLREIRTNIENKNRSSRVEIKVLYPSNYEILEKLSPIIERIAAFAYALSRNRYIVDIKNLLFLTSTFCLFSIFCLADQYLIGKFIELFGVKGLLKSASFWKGIHVIILIFWMYFLTKIVVLMFPATWLKSLKNLISLEVLRYYSLFLRQPKSWEWIEFDMYKHLRNCNISGEGRYIYNCLHEGNRK